MIWDEVYNSKEKKPNDSFSIPKHQYVDSAIGLAPKQLPLGESYEVIAQH